MIAWLFTLIAALAPVAAVPDVAVPTEQPKVARTAPAHAGVPSESQWLADVHDVLADAPDFVRDRAAQSAPSEQLALNLDIDNTSVATYFGGGPIPETLRLTRIAERHGVAVLFNTARFDIHRNRTLAQLRAAGYPVDGLCMRRGGEATAHSKQRCRAQYAAQGYTLIANLGNNPTDFAGRGYERSYRLPNYDGLLT